MTTSERHHLSIPALNIRSLRAKLNKQSLTSLLHDVALDAYFVFFTRFMIMMTQAGGRGLRGAHCYLEFLQQKATVR